MRVFMAFLLCFSLPVLGSVVIEEDFETVDNWQMNGSCLHESAGQFLQLTQNVGSQAGSAFYLDSVELNGEFSVTFEFEMSPDLTLCDADGLTFVIMDAEAGIDYVGGLGLDLGLGGSAGANAVYKTLMIEIDNYVDGGTIGDVKNNPYDAGYENHIGVGYHPEGLRAFAPRSQFLVNPVDPPFEAPDFEYGVESVEPSGIWRVEFLFNHGHFHLFLECLGEGYEWGPELVLEGTFQNYIPWENFGESIIGFTGGTGGCVMEHRIHNVTFTTPETPKQVPHNFVCEGLPGGDGILVQWDGPATRLVREAGAEITELDISGGSPLIDEVGPGVYNYRLEGDGTEPMNQRILYSPDPDDPFSKLTVYEEFEEELDPEVWKVLGDAVLDNGRMLLAPAVNSMLGFLVLDQPFYTEKFHIEFDWEIGGGNDADGLAIFFIPTGQADLVPGWPGGMIGQGGQGIGPVLGIEVDQYEGNGPDPAYEHIGVNYTSDPWGFIARDNMPHANNNTAFVDPTTFGMPNIRNSGQWHLSADIENGTVVVCLTPPGGDEQEVLSVTLEDWQPFTGYLGFCASTGGLNDNHWIDNLLLQVRAPIAPNNLTLDIQNEDDVTLSWENQYLYTSMEILRDGEGIATLNMGTTSYQDNNVPAGAHEYTLIVHYGGEEGRAVASCEIMPVDAVPSLSANGSVTKWLLLGPYSENPLAPIGMGNPGYENMAADWLTDGDVSETEIAPEAGDQVDTDYSGASIAYSLLSTPGNPDMNPGRMPTWYLWEDPDNNIELTDVHGSDINNAMSYGVCYIYNPTDSVQDVYCGFGSDDSCFVRLNGEEIHYHNQPRGSAGAIQNHACASLNPGMNTVMIKTFEAGGGFNFNFRLEDIDGNPIAFDMPFSYHTSMNAPAGTIAVSTDDGKTFEFTADVSGTVTSYLWDFDAADGLYQEATGQTVSHTFDANGTYLVSAVVTGNTGQQSVLHAQVEVTKAVAPVIKPVLPASDVGFENVAYRRPLALETGAADWSVTTAPADIGAAIDENGILTLPADSATGEVAFSVSATNAGGTSTVDFTVNFNLTEFVDNFVDDPLENPLWTVDMPHDGGNIDLFHDGAAETLVLQTLDATSNYDIWCTFDRAPKLLRPVTGDFSAEVKVTMLSEGDRNRQPGLIVEFDQSDAAPDAFLFGYLRNGVGMERVCGYDGMTAENSVVSDMGLVPPYDSWFRVDRVGTSYSFSYKMNEEDPWSNLYTTEFDLEPLTVGIFFKNWSSICSVEYDDFVLRPASEPGVSDLACTVSGSSVDLSWTELAGADSVRIIRDIFYDGETAAEIATLDPGTASYTDTPPVDRYGMVEYTVEATYDMDVAAASCQLGVAEEGWVAFQDGFAPTADYEGSEDAHIIVYRNEINEYNSGLNTSIEIGGNADGVDYKQTLIQFDLTDIAPGTTISDAVLSMHYWYERNGTIALPPVVNIYASPVFKQWSAGRGNGIDGEPALCDEVSWQSAARYFEFWEIPGAFGEDDIGDWVVEHELDTAAGQYRCEWQAPDMTDVVQGWVNDPSTNNGLKLSAPSDGDVHNEVGAHALGLYNFVSTDYPVPIYRPILMIRTGSAGLNVFVGDANCDAGVNIADAVSVLSYLFSGGEACCLTNMDANGDGGVNIADAVSVLSYLFSGGELLVPGGGAAVTEDSCATYDPATIAAEVSDCQNPCPYGK